MNTTQASLHTRDDSQETNGVDDKQQKCMKLVHIPPMGFGEVYKAKMCNPNAFWWYLRQLFMSKNVSK